jgi:hypothetical protein
LAAIIIPGQSGTYRHLPGRVTGLLADSGLTIERRFMLFRGVAGNLQS